MLVKRNSRLYKKCKNYLDNRLDRDYILHLAIPKVACIQLVYSFYGDSEDCKYTRTTYATYQQLTEDWVEKIKEKVLDRLNKA